MAPKCVVTWCYEREVTRYHDTVKITMVPVTISTWMRFCFVLVPFGTGWPRNSKILTYWGTETWLVENSIRESPSWSWFELETLKMTSKEGKPAQYRPSKPKIKKNNYIPKGQRCLPRWSGDMELSSFETIMPLGPCYLSWTFDALC